ENLSRQAPSFRLRSIYAGSRTARVVHAFRQAAFPSFRLGLHDHEIQSTQQARDAMRYFQNVRASGSSHNRWRSIDISLPMREMLSRFWRFSRASGGAVYPFRNATVSESVARENIFASRTVCGKAGRWRMSQTLHS